jgi:hypothetical protein
VISAAPADEWPWPDDDAPRRPIAAIDDDEYRVLVPLTHLVLPGDAPAWWVSAPREGFTELAAARTEASARTRVGRSVTGWVMQD